MDKSLHYVMMHCAVVMHCVLLCVVSQTSEKSSVKTSINTSVKSCVKSSAKTSVDKSERASGSLSLKAAAAQQMLTTIWQGGETTLVTLIFIFNEISIHFNIFHQTGNELANRC